MTQSRPVVACIKVGDKYPADYVNKLEAMIGRHTTLSYDFLCLTDDPRGLSGMHVADIGTTLTGWWSKLVLFRPHYAVEGRRVIFVDLDTVIVDNIDFMFHYDGPLAMISDWWANTYNSSLMSIAPGFGRYIWEGFMDYKDLAERHYHGDQDWITHCLMHAPETWQNFAPGKVASYKANNLQESPKDYSLICFHGNPKPHEVKGTWVEEHWRI